ncbi:ankyrin repeat domain-containing protein [Coxiella burnetii]|nr:ankyrin repeat domain-containing protein [Coxiella burnetii]
MKIIWNSSLRNCILYIFEECCSQDISSVQRILELVPKPSQHLLLDDPGKLPVSISFYRVNLSPFKRACQSGKLDIVQLLWSLSSSSNQKKLIENRFEASFILAAKNGHVEILKQLVKWVESKQLKISLLKSKDFSAFIYSADKGYLEIVQLIWESIPSPLQLEALKARNFAAYRLATKNQHHSVRSFLETKIDEVNRRKMKNAVNQGVFPKK